MRSEVKISRVLLLIESSRSSGRALLQGIADYSRLHGTWSFYWEPRGLETVVPKLRDWRPDGIIMRDYRPLDDTVAKGVPTISIGHASDQVPDVVSVVSDSEAIAEMAAVHLLGSGLRHFAFCGCDDKPWSVRRRNQFLAHIEKLGFDVSCYLPPADPASLNWESEMPYLVNWLKGVPRPAGLMACNDDRAEQVIEACKIAGIRVPDDIAIVGVDNDELVCSLSDPPLSSVELNFRRAGFESAEALDILMSGRPAPSFTIPVSPTRVVTRRSTEILAVDDPALVRALRYIRQSPRNPLSVTEVARAAAVSRRVLEKRFRERLGRSVLREIRQVRTDHIARLLIETDLSVQEIGVEMGFTGIEHVGRYFREMKGMSPLAFRRQYGRR